MLIAIVRSRRVTTVGVVQTHSSPGGQIGDLILPGATLPRTQLLGSPL
jgi:hypothetical protein